MSTAKITFRLPSTRVNGKPLLEGEIDHVDVYDNHYEAPDEDEEEEEGAEPRTAGEDESKGEYATAGMGGVSTKKGKKKKTKKTKAKKAGPEGEGTAEDDEEAQPRKLGSAGAGEREFTTPDLTPGIHYFTLVAVDTEDRSSSPSPAYKLGVEDPDETDPQVYRTSSFEPAQVFASPGAGSDPQRPGMVSEVTAVLV
jgi:hypothetical protein